MAKNVPQELHERGPLAWHRGLLASCVTKRALTAALVAPGILVLLLTVYERALLGRLPDYLAVVLAFLIAVVLPGLIIQRALLAERDADVWTRLAVAPALGLALAAVPGFIALEMHWDLHRFAVMHASEAAAVCALSALVPVDKQESSEIQDADNDRGGLVLLAMLGIVLAGVLTMPFWASGRVAGDFDDWTYMAYVREYLDTDQMNTEEPFLGTGEPVNPRMRSNVWVVMQALISDVSDVPPHEMLFEYLRPVLIAFTLLATYALTRTLFRSSSAAMLAVGMQLGYAFLDMAPHEGLGRNLFLRIGEDKMIAALLLFPVALVFLFRFLARVSPGSFVGFALVVLALSVVHPVPLVFLAVALLAFGAINALVKRTPRPLGTVGLLLVPVALASIWPFIQRQLLVDAAPDLFGTAASAITFRDEFHIIELGGGLLMGNFHMILHPLMLAALALTPVLWWISRRDTGHQLVFAMAVGAVTLFFVPVFATPLAEVMTPQTLWKMPWMVPVAPILGFLSYQAAVRLVGLAPAGWLGRGRLRSRVAFGLAPGVSLVLLLAAALVVQEQYVRLDGGVYYNWTSADSVVPGTNESIFLGGLDRAFSRTWRLNSNEERLFAFAAEVFPKGSVVLAEPWWLNHVLPGVLTDIYPVDFGGLAGEGPRREDVSAFADGALSGSQLGAVVERHGVTHIIATEVHPANDSVRAFPEAEWLAESVPYEVYEVRR